MNLEVPRLKSVPLNMQDMLEDVGLLNQMQFFYSNIIEKQNQSIIDGLEKLTASVDN